MKFNKIYSAVAATVMAFAMTGCDEERDFIVIDGNLPIKNLHILYRGRCHS